jgi:putative ABC transport system permease protein
MFQELLANPITLISVLLSLAFLIGGILFAVLRPRMFMLILKNLRRNKLRTILTSLAIMVLVFMVTMIWTVIYFLDQATTEKSKDFKIIITERWQFPSQLPQTHAQYLDPESPKVVYDPKEFNIGPGDFMTWSFYGGTTDITNMTRESIVFFFVMKPKHITTMMDDLQNLDPALIQKMKDTRNGCLLGRERMEAINKVVGERFKLTSFSFKGIDLDFEIVGALPDGRYNLSGIVNEDYFLQELDKYARQRGQRHPLDNKSLALIWLRVRDMETFNKLGDQIEKSPYFADRPVKVETASSGIGAFLDAYRGMLWGMKFLLVPAILITMALVIANAISISVRERRTEMAVMKVLGFRPRQILTLVLGESLLVGAVSGFVAAFATFALINLALGGINFPIAFFPAFLIPIWAIAWGTAMGGGTALAGSLLPARTAQSVKVSEVFSKVA